MTEFFRENPAGNTKVLMDGKPWEMTKAALAHLHEDPRRLHMPDFVLGLKGIYYTPADCELDFGRTAPPCGTVACLAGWTGLLAGMEEEAISTRSVLARMGVNYASPMGAALYDVYHRTWIKTYDQLCEALEELFEFPEPLPGRGA